MTLDKLEKMYHYYEALGFDTLRDIFKETFEMVKNIQEENNSLREKVEQLSIKDKEIKE